MNSAQKSAIQTNLAQLCNEIDVHEVIHILRVKQILTKDTVQRINKESDDKSKVLFLFDLLQSRDDGWEALLDALKEANQSNLAELLINSLPFENAT